MRSEKSTAWPFQSPQAAEICAHLSEQETKTVRTIRANAAAGSAATGIIFIVAIRLFGSHPIESILAGMALIAGLFLLCGSLAAHCTSLRSFLASTAYGQSQGVDAKTLPLFSGRKLDA
jgi:uncharacterized membrane protein YgdD (TMEM256/DUF423 family)